MEYPSSIDKVLEERRATISTQYIVDDSEWTQEIKPIEKSEGIVQFYLEKPLFPNTPVYIKIYGSDTHLYMQNNVEDNLTFEEILEQERNEDTKIQPLNFKVEYSNGIIFANFGTSQNFTIVIKHKTPTTIEKKYYVSLYYPEFKSAFYLNQKTEPDKNDYNRTYINWQFGDSIDENFNILPHKDNDCPVFFFIF